MDRGEHPPHRAHGVIDVNMDKGEHPPHRAMEL